MNFDTPEMLASVMERQQHRANPLQRFFSTGAMAGNDDIVILDISYWQNHERIDYDVLSKNIDGVILRGTYGIWKDTRFDIHYDNFHRRGVPVGSYAYLIGNYTGQEQADAFYNAVGNRELRMEVYADVEDQREGTRLNRAVTDQFIDAVDGRFKLLTSIYTGPYAWRAIMGWTYDAHKHRRLWIANYMVSSPMLPLGGGWTDWWMWQHTEKGTLPGYHSSLDLNRFRQSTQVYNNWVGEGTVEPEPEPEGKYRITLTGQLNIRDKPIDGRIIGGVYPGESYISNEEDQRWYKITRGVVTGWISGRTEFTTITIIGDPEDPPPDIEPSDEPLTRLYYPCGENWRVTQYFGDNPNWYPTARGHNGIDYGIPVGNPIYAAADGVVEVATEQTTGYGRHIRIRHSHGITIYGHMSRNDVKVGDLVRAKQIIGLSGGATDDPYSGMSFSMSTGPHLHFEYRWDKPAPQVPGGYVYNAVDPLPLLVSHTDEEPIMRAKVISPTLNVRTGVGTTHAVLYRYLQGTTVDVYEERDNWLRIGIGRWFSGLPQYVDRIEPEPDPKPEPEPEPEPDSDPEPDNAVLLFIEAILAAIRDWLMSLAK